MNLASRFAPLGLALATGAAVISATHNPVVAATLAEREAEFYPLITIPIPPGIVLEAGAIQAFGDHRLAVSTRLGEIWFVDGGWKPMPTLADAPASMLNASMVPLLNANRLFGAS